MLTSEQFLSRLPAIYAPFPNVKTRSGGGGRKLSYITARQAMNRLDAVLGPHNWRVTFREVEFEGSDGVVATIGIHVDGQWVEKSDGGGFKEMTVGNETDEENTFKTGYSDAFKRAAAMWPGVARYLYQDGTPLDERFRAGLSPAAEGESPSPPPAPDDWALIAAGTLAPVARTSPPARSEAPPDPSPGPPPPAREPAPATGATGEAPERYGRIPTSARGMFPWMKSLEESYRGFDAVGAIKPWAKKRKFHWKTSEWDDEQVSEGVAYVMGLLDEFLGIEEQATAASRP